MNEATQEDIIRDLIMTWPQYIQYGIWKYYRLGISIDSTTVDKSMLLSPGFGFIQLPYGIKN